MEKSEKVEMCPSSERPWIRRVNKSRRFCSSSSLNVCMYVCLLFVRHPIPIEYVLQLRGKPQCPSCKEIHDSLDQLIDYIRTSCRSTHCPLLMNAAHTMSDCSLVQDTSSPTTSRHQEHKVEGQEWVREG